ncbi:YafY family protein [Comamonas sp. NLF-1-9]|uniref:helix-turn-helix transcriptional regulator n=1 Tax=Comamonas sp. NLF-1-9 TaxID=2853163 RepID=UPI001C47DAEE|nr:WYL domain-containing protein [Comamonas sp. NLF-1-9]QXL85243.1 WYL domain-containing protein [Comamonas sp. NLF-1-9]
MPAQTTRQTLARQWELLKLLPSRGVGKTAAELTQNLNALGFKVSKRQVERDLWQLYEAFHLECNEGGAPYGWKWPLGASVDMPAMTLAEALSLALVQDILEPLLPPSLLVALQPRFDLAHRKLDQLKSNNPSADWLKKVATVPPALPLQPARLANEVLEAVHEGLLRERQLEVSYQGQDAKVPISIRLHPLGVVNRGPVSYLVATAWDYDDVRLYAMHRIHAAALTEEPARQPASFELDAYIRQGALQFGGEHTIRLKARVSDELRRILAETPLSEDQVLEGHLLSASVRETWQLTWWILSQGAGMEVLEPKALRGQIAAKIAEAHARYQSAPN